MPVCSTSVHQSYETSQFLLKNDTRTNVEMHKSRHEMLQRHRMCVQNITQNTIRLVVVAKDSVKQGLCEVAEHGLQ